MSRVAAATIVGSQVILVEIEVDAHRGVPGLILVGLPSKAVDEARERITSALHNCGIKLKSKRTVVNLAPADIPKTGSTLDLAIAAGLLHQAGKLRSSLSQTLLIGELGLDGSVKPVKGALAIVMKAAAAAQKVIIPAGNAAEVSAVTFPEVFVVSHLNDLITNSVKKPALQHNDISKVHTMFAPSVFLQIKGQSEAKRALSLAAAGQHSLLMTGPPGVGKTMLAQACSELLPPLSTTEQLEVGVIQSSHGSLVDSLPTHPPFRAPHHSISVSRLIGGGNPIRAGEISLAHRGVLFLDELGEFSRQTLEMLRQPLETKTIMLAKGKESICFPADFTLIAAMNPCPCGFYGSSERACRCSTSQLNTYQGKLSEPLLDRIDLHVRLETPPVASLKPIPDSEQQNYLQLKNRIQVAHHRRKLRQKTHQGVILSHPAELFLKNAYEKLQLSVRSYHKVIAVAQTIVDLDYPDQEKIEIPQLAEALSYRASTKK